MSTHPSSEERLMASIAHASVVVFGPGNLIGTLIWLTQKEKSAYASHQGLQAAIYQLIGMIVIMAMWLLWGVFYALNWIPLIRDIEKFEEAPPPIFWIGLVSMIIPFLVVFVWTVYGLWGAWRTLRSRDFRYIIIGKLLPSG